MNPDYSRLCTRTNLRPISEKVREVGQREVKEYSWTRTIIKYEPNGQLEFATAITLTVGSTETGRNSNWKHYYKLAWHLSYVRVARLSCQPSLRSCASWNVR